MRINRRLKGFTIFLLTRNATANAHTNHSNHSNHSNLRVPLTLTQHLTAHTSR